MGCKDLTHEVYKQTGISGKNLSKKKTCVPQMRIHFGKKKMTRTKKEAAVREKKESVHKTIYLY